MMVQQCQRLLFDSFGLRFAAASEFERIEGIQRCLTGLRSRGLRLGVVSNYPETGESLRSVLSRLEIADPFEFVVSSADYGIGKPHPLTFETAMAKLGVDGSTTWFVGDTLELDIAGANGASLFSV